MPLASTPGTVLGDAIIRVKIDTADAKRELADAEGRQATATRTREVREDVHHDKTEMQSVGSQEQVHRRQMQVRADRVVGPSAAGLAAAPSGRAITARALRRPTGLGAEEGPSALGVALGMEAPERISRVSRWAQRAGALPGRAAGLMGGMQGGIAGFPAAAGAALGLAGKYGGPLATIGMMLYGFQNFVPQITRELADLGSLAQGANLTALEASARVTRWEFVLRQIAAGQIDTTRMQVAYQRLGQTAPHAGALQQIMERASPTEAQIDRAFSIQISRQRGNPIVNWGRMFLQSIGVHP